ncbi:hypothetical protein NS31R_18010 [Enterobacter cancerogenus]|nr:hypothetical protein NS104_02545 [Enterobacter cancerogenus]KTQ54367.1 hypothetical protein NS111_01420 [Enterobacter cancerogenus]KTQ75722.1 hypothetical protein NS188_00090 [Enterobacter cancerogenus]KTQ78115.1 hypothetical protein NS31R_18010 [Enterobacter cancerogenus]
MLFNEYNKHGLLFFYLFKLNISLLVLSVRDKEWSWFLEISKGTVILQMQLFLVLLISSFSILLFLYITYLSITNL